MTDSEQHDANPALLHIAKPDEFFPQVSSWSRVGGLTLVVAFAALLLLCSVLPYNVTVQAQAAIRPAGELRIVQAQLKGPIQEILVTQDQTIVEGSVIAYIDVSSLRTEQNKLEAEIENASQRVVQLQAQLTAFDRQIAAEQELLQRRQTTAQAEVKLREREREQLLITTAADVLEAQSQVDLAREELSRYTTLAERGVVSELEIRELEAKLRVAEAQLTRVEAALNPSEAEIEIASANIVQERARGEATLATLLRERQQLLQLMTDNRTVLENQEEDLHQIAADIASAAVRSPVTGGHPRAHSKEPGPDGSGGRTDRANRSRRQRLGGQSLRRHTRYWRCRGWTARVHAGVCLPVSGLRHAPSDRNSDIPRRFHVTGFQPHG